MNERRRYTCPRCNTFVEATLQDDGTAVCPHCENSTYISHPSELMARIAELDTEVTKCHELQDSYCDRIAELEADKRRAEQMIERLIENGEWAQLLLTDEQIYMVGEWHEGQDMQHKEWQALVEEWRNREVRE